MVVGFTITSANSTYHHLRCEFESRSWGGVLDTGTLKTFYLGNYTRWKPYEILVGNICLKKMQAGNFLETLSKWDSVNSFIPVSSSKTFVAVNVW
jgi:hypothetical protein